MLNPTPPATPNAQCRDTAPFDQRRRGRASGPCPAQLFQGYPEDHFSSFHLFPDRKVAEKRRPSRHLSTQRKGTAPTMPPPLRRPPRRKEERTQRRQHRRDACPRRRKCSCNASSVSTRQLFRKTSCGQCRLPNLPKHFARGELFRSFCFTPKLTFRATFRSVRGAHLPLSETFLQNGCARCKRSFIFYSATPPP